MTAAPAGRSSAQFLIEPLDTQHDRTHFAFGVPALDRYFREQVSQDVRRRVTACFAVVESTTLVVAGCYTLSAGSVPLDALPPATAKKLPRYPSVPVVRMGRLAVSVPFHGAGLGAALLADALARAANVQIGAYALLVDAKEGNAAAFYAHHGFKAFAHEPLTLFLPLATVAGIA